MAQSPIFRCKICTAPHGGMHAAMCPSCAKKWKNEVEEVGKLVRSLATDPKDFALYVHKTIDDIGKKLGTMKNSVKK